jgi:transaldolase
MNTPQKKFAEELDRIGARYESQFAGMPRANRNVDELDAILAETKGVLSRIESIPTAVRPPELNELAETAHQNVAIYERERKLIADASNAAPEMEQFATFATSANFVFSRYRRHYAGKSRATRDLGLLAEMVEDLEAIEKNMAEIIKASKNKTELSRDLDLVRRTLETYRGEEKEIRDARKMGTAEERASALAEVANGQFRIYQMHFAGKSRATRRPALLQRVIDQLQTTLGEMRELKQGGLATGHNEGNVEIVERQIETYKTELGEVRAARKGIAFGDLLGNLGGAANEVFDTFRKDFAGQDRKTRDIEKLSSMCDELGDVRRQMLDVGRAEPNASNDSNIDIVSSQLASFEQEYEQIALAQK